MFSHSMRVAAIALVAGLAAQAASAEIAPANPDAEAALAAAPFLGKAGVEAIRATIGLHGSPVRATRIPGIAQTSVDHRFASDGVVGQAGFLCGMQPGHNEVGGVSARGYDPQGKFLGAKLSFAFR